MGVGEVESASANTHTHTSKNPIREIEVMDVRGGGDEAAFWKHKTCLLNCAVCKPLSPTHTVQMLTGAPTYHFATSVSS